MSSFFKKINHNPFGDKLREARLNKGLTIRQAGRDLSVSAKYLEALENYELNLIPADSINRLIENYGGYLGLKFKELSELRKDTESFKTIINIKKQQEFSIYDLSARFFLWFVAIIFLLFLAYSIGAVFAPPKLAISSPTDGLITYQRQLPIRGMTAPEAEVIINNRAVFVDSHGNFSTEIDLQKGLNLIKINAKKRYSRTQEATIRVLFNE